MADAYSSVCFEPGFAARRAAFFEAVRRNPPAPHPSAVHHELARFAADGVLHEPLFHAALDTIDARRDCADFVLHGILRLLHQFGSDPRLPRSLVERADRSVLGFKYWPDEPGVDSMCTWTENHQILFASAELLAAQRHPQALFTNSQRHGWEKRDAARARVLRWLELRFRTGMSEWLSHCYYDEDLVALLSLADFVDDPEIATRASMLVDLLLFDLALGSFQGVFGTSHGRSYERMKKWCREEGTTDVAKLAFGTGSFARIENMSAVSLALSPRYRLPAVLVEVSRECAERSFSSEQRMGLRVDDAERWGFDLDRIEDGMTLLSMESYAHPRTIELFVRMLDAYGWWDNEFFAPFAARRHEIERMQRDGTLRTLARELEHDLTRNLREEVNLVTWRTPDTMLSTAQDWRAGFGGDQQHVWQATLGPDAVCFTTHPGPRGAGTPDYWTGSGTLPRAVQSRNVCMVHYRLEERPALYVPLVHRFTHAWLPRDRFDEVRESGGWIFARRGEGYLAIRSERPVRWQEAPGEDHGRELIAEGSDNHWICELGRSATEGSFKRFVEAVATSPVAFGAEGTRYRSPTRGELVLRPDGTLLRNGAPEPTRDFPRYRTPFAQAPFPMDEIEIRAGGERLRLAWREGERRASTFVDLSR